MTGAYRFEVRPGKTTQVEVQSRLYPRRNIDKLGVAPLTSMFLFGESPQGKRFDDFRPEVHDSDGLMINNGAGEWLWRPLVNPKELMISGFQDEDPKGFGLMQRDRTFNNYQDNESRFERRPSYWIEPLGKWGKGSVELVELPTREEIHDNIVAYWVPGGERRGRQAGPILLSAECVLDVRHLAPGRQGDCYPSRQCRRGHVRGVGSHTSRGHRFRRRRSRGPVVSPTRQGRGQGERRRCGHGHCGTASWHRCLACRLPADAQGQRHSGYALLSHALR